MTLLLPPHAVSLLPPGVRPARRRWAAAWARPAFRWRLALVGLLLLHLALLAPSFYHFVQGRTGHRLADPLLARLPAHDVSAPTFALIYGSIAATLAFLVPRPRLLLRALWAYVLLQGLRMLTLSLLPLEPPAGLLVLHDPVMEHLLAASQHPIVRDLFFSGHTATAALLVLAVRGRRGRAVLALLAGAIGTLVLVQHAHYSCDVLAAPFFAWLAYRWAGRVCRPRRPARQAPA